MSRAPLGCAGHPPTPRTSGELAPRMGVPYLRTTVRTTRKARDRG